MKVALINPRGTIFSKNEKMTEFLQNSVSMGSFRHFWSAPCLGLLTIAAYFPTDWEIEYIDENYRTIDFAVKYDFVCISAMTVQAERTYEIIYEFKERGILTVIGGIHTTVMPEEAMNYADVVLAGEGEVIFPEFLHDYMRGRYKKLYTEINPGNFDLKNCIPPRYELIKDYEYPIVNIYTTRGCPRKCNFCCASNVYGLKYRRKTNNQIMTEIDIISQLYPDKLILFADDNLFVLRKESKELLRKLALKNTRWIAQTDIAISNDGELLKLMYDSGCQWIVIGFESVSEKSLKSVENDNFKYRYIHDYKEKIQIIQSYGIKIYGTFIVGLDEDKEDVFNNTANFILNNQLYGANITVPTPLPGTELRKRMEQEDRIISNNWSDYTLWDVVINPKQMSVTDLEAGLLFTYKKISEQNNADNRLRGLLKDIKKEYREKKCCILTH